MDKSNKYVKVESEGVLLLVGDIQNAIAVLVFLIDVLHGVLCIEKEIPTLGTLPLTNKKYDYLASFYLPNFYLILFSIKAFTCPYLNVLKVRNLYRLNYTCCSGDQEDAIWNASRQ